MQIYKHEIYINLYITDVLSDIIAMPIFNICDFIKTLNEKLENTISILRFIIGFEIFVKNYGFKNLITSLKQSYGIPNQQIIDSFNKALSCPETQEDINKIIIISHYEDPVLCKKLEPYRKLINTHGIHDVMEKIDKNVKLDTDVQVEDMIESIINEMVCILK